MDILHIKKSNIDFSSLLKKTPKITDCEKIIMTLPSS